MANIQGYTNFVEAVKQLAAALKFEQYNTECIYRDEPELDSSTVGKKVWESGAEECVVCIDGW